MGAGRTRIPLTSKGADRPRHDSHGGEVSPDEREEFLAKYGRDPRAIAKGHIAEYGYLATRGWMFTLEAELRALTRSRANRPTLAELRAEHAALGDRRGGLHPTLLAASPALGRALATIDGWRGDGEHALHEAFVATPA